MKILSSFTDTHTILNYDFEESFSCFCPYNESQCGPNILSSKKVTKNISHSNPITLVIHHQIK